MSRSYGVIVVGAGIVGASIAYHLAKRGADVAIVDRIGIAAGATGKSFAWINAHHFKSEGYHQFRFQSIADYHRLDRELEGRLGLSWSGALSFDALGKTFDERVERFRMLGYPAEVVTHNRFGEIEPAFGHPPGRAMHLPLEAAIEPARAAAALIEAAVRLGARTLFGSDVSAIRTKDGNVAGIETDHGEILAERVVVAAGVGAEAILKHAGIELPMDNKPGVMLRTPPLPPTLHHVIWGDRIHMKQQDDGRLVIGEIFSEKGQDMTPSLIAEQMLADARRHLPNIDLQIECMTIGLRPIPKDGLPVVGPTGDTQGLYVAVMHSGVTLAPIVGRMAAEEMLDGVQFPALTPYRPNRFQEVAAGG